MLPSLHHLCLDFPRSNSCVCRGGFPSHCNGEVRFPGLVFCEEELAVCHLWHWRLHQLYDHHVSQRGGCLDKHHLARLHILSNKRFMKHLFRALFQELSRPQPERLFVFFFAEIPVCLSFSWSLPSSTFSLLMLMSTIILPGVWKGGLSADKLRWALSTCCMHSYLHYLSLLRRLASIYFLLRPPHNPCFSPLRAPTDRVWVGEQLCSEDVPVPVCNFEQLHILHRVLSRKVGLLPWTLQFLFTLNLMRDCAEMFYVKLPCHDCQDSFPFLSHCSYFSCLSIRKILPWLEM